MFCIRCRSSQTWKKISKSVYAFSDHAAYRNTFLFRDLQMQLAGPEELQEKPAADSLVFGKHFTDHMLSVSWNAVDGWSIPRIAPIQPISLHPAAKVLHYALELFEGMKAYRGVDDRIRLFRPELNMRRMNKSAERAVLPQFDSRELIECIKRLVAVDQEWVPHCPSSSLYIRPTLIGTEPTLGVSASNNAMLFVILGPVGSYFSSGLKPVSLLADPAYTRAWHGGCGFAKMGSNYAPTVMVQRLAEKQKLQQVMWLYGEDHQVTEVGTMNIFCVIRDKAGVVELVTPPLDGIVLPGVTRQSIIDLAVTEETDLRMTERKITMAELFAASEEGRLLEIFGSGTACIVCPVQQLSYLGRDLFVPTPSETDSVAHRMLQRLTDIHYGRRLHDWAQPIDS